MRCNATSPALLILTLFGSLIAACGGGEDRPDAISNPPVGDGDGDLRNGDGDGDAGDGDAGDGDGDVGDGDGDVGDGDGDGDGVPDPPGPDEEFNLPGAPLVELLWEDEVNGERIFSDTIFVSCEVAQSDEPDSLPPDAETISIALWNASDEIVQNQGASASGEDGVYTAEFPISNLSEGEYTIRCTAADSGTDPKYGLAEETIYIDHGPAITLIRPVDMEFVSGAFPKTFEVAVDPAVLFAGDDGAELSGPVTISIEDFETELTLKEGEDDVYWLEGLDLSSPVIFPSQIPEGPTQVTVTATNARGVTREIFYEIIVDSVGPVITINSPDPFDVVGKEVTIQMTVEDESAGVDWDTLRITFGPDVEEFTLAGGAWTRVGSVATFTFLSNDYLAERDLILNIDVKDTLGNATATGDVTYRLDEYGPILSLDPPNFREHDADYECSYAFDPVGEDALNDGDDATHQSLLRAVVWERTYHQNVQEHFPAYVDPESVRLWIAPAGAPIVMDSTGDGICDAINQAGTGATVLTLAPVAPAGSPRRGDETAASTEDLLPGPSRSESRCAGGYETASPLVPEPLCNGASDLTVAVNYPAGGTSVPALYAYNVGQGVICDGTQVGLGDAASSYEGWICVAVAAVDNVGNRSVSKPIALCLDSSADGLDTSTPSCAGGAEPPPDCTGTCTPLTFENHAAIHPKAASPHYFDGGVIYRGI